ncbi:MAG: UvrB/UvrC motif-containing protein [bacterium]
MTCEHCHHHAATVHIQEITDGTKVGHHFCADCAQAKGLVPNHGNPLGFATALLNMVKADLSGTDSPDAPAAGAEPALELDTLTCAACGLRGTEFRKLGRLGCARCYDTFTPVFTPLLATLHRGPCHVGKIPANAVATTVMSPVPQASVASSPPPPPPPLPPSPAELMVTLEEDLRSAVLAENYERAAHLRDQLHALRAPSAAT